MTILKIKSLCLILFLLSFLLMHLGGSSIVNAGEKEVTYVKIQEKTYDKLIKGMALGSVVKGGQVEVYPKVIVLEDEVQFLDETGRIVSRKPLQSNTRREGEEYYGRTAILSKRGNFVALYDYIGKSADVDYIVEQEYTILNDRGEEIYKIKGLVEGKDWEDRLFISDKDGSAVETRIAYGAIDFYSPNGEMKTVPIFGELGWGNRIANLAFSDDGEYLSVLVADRAKPATGVLSFKADVWVILFDKNGIELWRRKVDESQIGNIAISKKGEYLIFKAYAIAGETPPKKGEHRDLASVTLALYDKEGKGLNFKDVSLFSFGSFCFSPQADYVAIGGGNLIRLIKTKDGSTVYEKELPKDIAITQLLFSDDGEYLIIRTRVPIGTEKITERATTLERQYRTVYTDRVFLYNMNGDQVWYNDFFGLRGIYSKNAAIAFFCSSPDRYEIYKLK